MRFIGRIAAWSDWKNPCGVSEAMKRMDVEGKQALQPEKPAYPWQILEADGETWVIVRWKEVVTTQPLRDLEGVYLENFSWELLAEQEEKCFYAGELIFQIYYRETDITKKEPVGQEPWVEEFLFNESLFNEKNQENFASSAGENYNQETAFSSFLLAGGELKESQEDRDSLAEETKCRKVILPWRCWLKGRGKNETPVLQKVHLTQAGLYTLLLEALIKLEKRQEFPSQGEAALTTTVEEEKMYEMTEDSVLEPLGFSVERAFWRYTYDSRRENLFLRARKITSLIYVSTEGGGERFLLATGPEEEETVIFKGVTKSLYPAILDIRCEQMKPGLIGTNKIFYQCKHLYCLQGEPPQSKILAVAAAESDVVKREVTLGPALLKRNKPGERWMKKKECSDKWRNRTIITIKL